MWYTFLLHTGMKPIMWIYFWKAYVFSEISTSWKKQHVKQCSESQIIWYHKFFSVSWFEACFVFYFWVLKNDIRAQKIHSAQFTQTRISLRIMIQLSVGSPGVSSLLLCLENNMCIPSCMSIFFTNIFIVSTLIIFNKLDMDGLRHSQFIVN